MKKLTYEEILSERLEIEEAKNASRFPITIIADNIRSIYNVGSLFRTCDSAFVDELILCGFTPHPPREEISKTALDSERSVPWSYLQSTKEAIMNQKNLGKTVIALELTDKKRPYTALNKEDFPLAIVLGNELSGISNEILSHCDSAVEIPMFGVKHSLNVSVSAGIVIFEAVRKYHKFYKEHNPFIQ